MYMEANWDLGLPDITNSTTLTVSPDLHDAGAAKILFGTGKYSTRLMWKTVITADAAPNFLCDFIATAETDLDGNLNGSALPVCLGSSGIVRTDDDGTNLATGDTITGEFVVTNQRVARRYYGLHVTLGGTNPDIVEATSQAILVQDAQSNMVYL